MRPIVAITWNIEFGVEVGAAIEVISGHPDLAAADVLMCQELDEPAVDRLSSELGLHAAYRSACRHPQTGRDFGNAIFCRTPLTDEEVIDLPHQATVQGTPRLAIRAATTIDGNEIAVWCTHTETPAMRREKRLEQFRVLADAVSADPFERVIVGGDFNTVTQRGVGTVSNMMAAAGATRISFADEPTLRRGGKSFTLDHLFARGLVGVERGVVPAGRASDHDALWARLDSGGERSATQ